MRVILARVFYHFFLKIKLASLFCQYHVKIEHAEVDYAEVTADPSYRVVCACKTLAADSIET